jgi:hypothetical protein
MHARRTFALALDGSSAYCVASFYGWAVVAGPKAGRCRRLGADGGLGLQPIRAEVMPGMKHRTHLLIIFSLAALCGCRADVHRELLERELRWQEEEIDHMESHVIEYKRRLASLERENAALREKLAEARARAQAAGETEGTTRRRTRGRNSEDAERIRPPEVELDEQPAPSNGRPERVAPGSGVPEGEPAELPPDDSGELPELEPLRDNDGANGQAPAGSGATGGAPGGHSAAAASSGPRGNSQASSTVERIVINPQGTHGYDSDGKPGDDGLRLLVEPRDRRGRIVHVPGELHVELYQPTSEGEIPVARWVFTAEQTAQRLAATPEGQGMEYTLRWPAAPPSQRQVKLYVRYLPQDGGEVTDELPLVVRLSAATVRRMAPPGGRQPVPSGTPSAGRAPARRRQGRNP